MAVYEGFQLPGYVGPHPFREICEGWIGKIDRAKQAKAPWQMIADECMAFYSAATGFLWDPKYRHKFWDTSTGEVNPKFRLTIARAFELVALFGPTLYWRNPTRVCTPKQFVQAGPDVLAMMLGIDWEEAMQFQQQAQAAMEQGQQLDPQSLQQLFQIEQIMTQVQGMEKQERMEFQARTMRASLMEAYLNWTPNELRLHSEAELAITEALVKGRGCLWTEPYFPPESNRVMIGSFRDAPENLLIDPDAETLEDAWWIAKQCVYPIWQVERDYKLQPGTLAKKGSYESVNSQEERGSSLDVKGARERGETQDLITIWKVWSRCGAGARLTGVESTVKERVDEVLGDYVHMVVARGVPFPLNMPTDRMMDAPVEDVQRAFRWPIPYHRDGGKRWPVACLDFYRNPRSPWPIAPLAPGLGELKAVNVFLSHLANHIWMSGRTFIAVLESARESVENVLAKGEDLAFIGLEDLHGDINKVVQFLEHPPVNADVWTIINSLLDMFDRRTGLSELMYGLGPRNQGQIRSATDASIRQNNLQVRPDYMAAKVEEWMTEAACREALAVKHEVEGKDVVDVLGPVGAQLWDFFITPVDFERIVRDIEFRLEANSAKKPNRDRDADNLQNSMGWMFPFLQTHYQMTGDAGPAKWFIDLWGKTVEMPTQGLQFQPPPPPPGAEEQMQMQQQQIQAELEMEQQKSQQQLALEQQKTQAQLGMDQQRHSQEMRQDKEVHAQEIAQAKDQRKQQAAAAKQQLTLAQMKAKAQAKAMSRRPSPAGGKA